MRNLKSVFLTVLAATAFTACSNDDIVDGSSPGSLVPTGEETYVTFNFKVEGSKPNTRAAMIPDTGLDEEKVGDGRILIFDAATGVLITNEKIEGGNKTFKTTSGERRVYVLTGTDKTQMNTRLDALNPGKTLTDFYAVMTDGKLSDAEIGTVADVMGAGFEELIESSKFMMSNPADRTAVKTILPGISSDKSATEGDIDRENLAVNRFEFKVQRAIAKGDLKIQLKAMETDDHVFQLSADATYGVRNVNRSTLYVQQFISNQQVNDDLEDTHNNKAIRPFAAFYNAFDAPGTDMTKLATYKPYYYGGYDIKGVDAVGVEIKTAGVAAGEAVYFSENSNNQQVRGNTSYYGITTQVAKIEAANIAKSIKFDDTTTKITTEANDAAYEGTGDFWAIREIPADVIDLLEEPIRFVFLSEDLAFEALTILINNAAGVSLTTTGFERPGFTVEALKNAYNEAKGITAIGGTALNAADVTTVERYLGHYKDGYSYYRLNIYETTADGDRRHLVRRNHYYNATITAFKTIGAPNEEDLDKDPEKPVDADATNVTAIIKVAPWHQMTMEDEL